MNIAIFEFEPRERPAFDVLRHAHDVVSTEKPLTTENANQFAGAEIISTFIYSKLEANVLEQLPILKLIATRSTGYDHIDARYCLERGIKVSNVPTYGENTVAEHVFALLLAISHRLREAMERARSGRFSPEGLEGFDLDGKTVGVIGTGHIGRHVIRIARGFGMQVLAFDARPAPELAPQLGFQYVSLDDLLAKSDIVTLHVPALPATDHLLDARAFSRMKQGVVVINTSRGSIVDARALIQALKSGKVAAAGLDVLPDEPLIREEAELICSTFCNQQHVGNLVANHLLLNMPNVVVTPHSAFNTKEAIQRIVSTTVANIQSFLDGNPKNIVIGK